MAIAHAPQRRFKTASEVVNVAVDFSGLLDTGETINTVAVTEITTSVFTITNKQKNTAILTINGKSVAVGEAVQFTLNAAGAAGTVYSFDVQIVTTGGLAAATRKRRVDLEVIADPAVANQILA